jgi:hypothetical protein
LVYRLLEVSGEIWSGWLLQWIEVKFISELFLRKFLRLSIFHRSRIMFNLIPLSPFLLLGITDIIAYRKMIDHVRFCFFLCFFPFSEFFFQRTISENVFAVAKEISKENNNAIDLFNYGVLTLLHVVPGFLSFVGMR